MTKRDDKAGLPLLPTKTLTTEQQALTERLSKLEDQLHNLLACYRFYGEAIIAITDPERLDDSKEWHLGLFLYQQWLRQLGEELMQELIVAQRAIRY